MALEYTAQESENVGLHVLALNGNAVGQPHFWSWEWGQQHPLQPIIR
jgi:hypothetical protein